jgi:hypothetical protein
LEILERRSVVELKKKKEMKKQVSRKFQLKNEASNFLKGCKVILNLI